MRGQAIASRMTTVLGTQPSRFRSGLNNQRTALLGLCAKALATECKVRIPELLTDINVVKKRRSRQIRFDTVFDAEAVADLLTRWNLNAGGAEVTELFDWISCFSAGRHQLIPHRGGPGFVQEFLVAIRAAPKLRKLAKIATDKLGKDIPAVQLRVEHDWQRYVRGKQADGSTDLWVTSADEIFARIRKYRGFRDTKALYLCCDQRGIEDLDEIRRLARQHGFEALFKQDVLDESDIPKRSMSNASLDFEICLQAHHYIGLQRSSFSGLLFAIAAALPRRRPPLHFIYDVPGDSLGRREFLNWADEVQQGPDPRFIFELPSRPPA
jgi:hypothetical protein